MSQSPVAGHALTPATRRRLGRLLPYQLPDGSQAAPPAMPWHAFTSRSHPVLATVSSGCPGLEDTFLRVTHPFATSTTPEESLLVRLACVKHAASVRPEPGSNPPSKISSSISSLSFYFRWVSLFTCQGASSFLTLLFPPADLFVRVRVYILPPFFLFVNLQYC